MPAIRLTGRSDSGLFHGSKAASPSGFHSMRRQSMECNGLKITTWYIIQSVTALHYFLAVVL